MSICPLCKAESRGTLWIRLWPFNFRLLDCAKDGPVADEDWLWDRIWTVMHFLTPWDGTVHMYRHPWWKVAPH